MRVFISHKKEDSETASRIAYRLRIFHQVDCYVDVFDPMPVRLATILATTCDACFKNAQS